MSWITLAMSTVVAFSKIDGWTNVKFLPPDKLPAFPLRFPDGSPALLVEHRGTQHHITGFDHTGEISSVGFLDAKGDPVGIWEFFRTGSRVWKMDFDTNVALGPCPKVGFKQTRRTGPEFVFSCIDSGGKRTGLEETLNIRGGVLQSGFNRDDRHDGAWVKWSDSGSKSQLEVFQEGVLDGPYVRWGPDGTQPDITGQYVGGRAVGAWTYRCGGVTTTVAFPSPVQIEVADWIHSCTNPFQVVPPPNASKEQP